MINKFIKKFDCSLSYRMRGCGTMRNHKWNMRNNKKFRLFVEKFYNN